MCDNQEYKMVTLADPGALRKGEKKEKKREQGKVKCEIYVYISTRGRVGGGGWGWAAKEITSKCTGCKSRLGNSEEI